MLVILAIVLASTLSVPVKAIDEHVEDDCNVIIETLRPWEDNPTTSFLMIDEGGLSQDLLAEQIIDYARTFLGRPYAHGAKGPKAFDCSGFTSYVFGNFDIDLSPSSSTQYTQGESIPTEEVRPGDLLFFSGRRSGRSGVGHVAMAVDVDENGKITFIHAAIKGGIRYDTYPDGGYYSQRYIGARRVIK